MLMITKVGYAPSGEKLDLARCLWSTRMATLYNGASVIVHGLSGAGGGVTE